MYDMLPLSQVTSLERGGGLEWIGIWAVQKLVLSDLSRVLRIREHELSPWSLSFMVSGRGPEVPIFLRDVAGSQRWFEGHSVGKNIPTAQFWLLHQTSNLPLLHTEALAGNQEISLPRSLPATPCERRASNSCSRQMGLF